MNGVLLSQEGLIDHAARVLAAPFSAGLKVQRPDAPAAWEMLGGKFDRHRQTFMAKVAERTRR